MTIKIVRIMTNFEELLPIMLLESLVTLVTNQNHIFTTVMSMTTQLGKMLTYFELFLPINISTIRTAISVLPQSLRPPNLAKW